jgi:hypothetical protein
MIPLLGYRFAKRHEWGYRMGGGGVAYKFVRDGILTHTDTYWRILTHTGTLLLWSWFWDILNSAHTIRLGNFHNWSHSLPPRKVTPFKFSYRQSKQPTFPRSSVVGFTVRHSQNRWKVPNRRPHGQHCLSSLVSYTALIATGPEDRFVENGEGCLIYLSAQCHAVFKMTNGSYLQSELCGTPCLSVWHSAHTARFLDILLAHLVKLFWTSLFIRQPVRVSNASAFYTEWRHF